MLLPPSNLGRVRCVPRTIVLDASIMVKNRPTSNGISGICFSNLAIFLVTDCDTGTDFALQKCAKIKYFREESQLLIFSRKWEMSCIIWSNIEQIQPEFLASSLGKYRIKEQKMIENCFNFEKRKYEQAAHWEKQVRYIPVTGGRRPESGSDSARNPSKNSLHSRRNHAIILSAAHGTPPMNPEVYGQKR
ncbi:MAG: hypothetical protein IKP72_18535 [Clostridia bacterium]|nr:hypothetical protein [Clostridia bacterium]